MATAVASSAAMHAIALAALLTLRQPVVTRPVIVLPVSLVSLAGGGDGSERAGGGDAKPSAVADPTTPPPPVAAPVPPTPVVATTASHPKPVPKPKQIAEPRSATTEPAAESTAVASLPSSGAVGSGAAGAGTGPGGGSGAGLGSGAASPAYGVNPEPPYPLAARRMGLEGTVLLRVVVGADGSPVSVAVLQSSGHAILDTSAADTVRAKWRFVPARRNGVPVEDAVQVPIRFHQTTG
jgi:protein TonB